MNETDSVSLHKFGNIEAKHGNFVMLSKRLRPGFRFRRKPRPYVDIDIADADIGDFGYKELVYKGGVIIYERKKEVLFVKNVRTVADGTEIWQYMKNSEQYYHL